MTSALDTNLRALDRLDPGLADRIRWPVASDHVRLPDQGPPLYRIHRHFYPFMVPEEDLAGSVAGVTGQQQVFLFGVGLGEQLGFLAERFPDLSLVIWDRDPWLLRLALSRQDHSASLAAGKLRILLGADLVEACDSTQEFLCIVHPFLGRVYHLEQRLLGEDLRDQRVLLQSGTLFVDDLGQALREKGYSVYSLDTERLSREEQVYAIRKLQPSFIAAINYTEGLAEFCQEMALPLICWEIDPALATVRPVNGSTAKTHIFTYRRAHVKNYQDRGFAHVRYLPLAANPKRRRPLELKPKDLSTYAAPVSFVGASLQSEATEFKERFLERYTDWRDRGAEGRAEGRRLLEDALQLQRNDFSRYVFPALLEARFAAFLQAERDSHPEEDPILLAAEMAASEKRLVYVAALADLEIAVWGDAGWQTLVDPGVRYKGRYARHNEELTRVYCATRINIDIGRLHQSDIITMRVFDVLACGGFILAERSEALLELFQPGVHLDCYATLNELRDKTAYYLDHGEEAARIAAQGMERVRSDHTMAGRLDHMLEKAGIPR